MTLLRAEREALHGFLPGLDKYLSEIPLLELERPGNGALAKFRELGGPALLVPAEYEGKGATLLDAVRIQRAVGSRSPSLTRTPIPPGRTGWRSSGSSTRSGCTASSRR